MLDKTQIDLIAKNVATANLAAGSVKSAIHVPALDADSKGVLYFTIVLAPGTAENIDGDAALETAIGIREELGKLAEERFPFVEYAEEGELVEGEPHPDHLIEQAERLIGSNPGQPRQADLRSAVSAVYYAVFHAIAAAAADQFVGTANQKTERYRFVYRGLEPRRLREICTEATNPTPCSKCGPFLPVGPDIKAFATAVKTFSEKRHLADYDPFYRAKRSDALVSIREAKAALARFRNAPLAERTVFLTLLHFSPARTGICSKFFLCSPQSSDDAPRPNGPPSHWVAVDLDRCRMGGCHLRQGLV
jgi:uncharacterized protein (UPF0332 family)